MKLNKMERMAMNFFDDGNVEHTMQRLCVAAMLSPKPRVKKTLCGLVEKLRGNYEKPDAMTTDDIASMQEEYTEGTADKKK